MTFDPADIDDLEEDWTWTRRYEAPRNFRPIVLGALVGLAVVAVGVGVWVR